MVRGVSLQMLNTASDGFDADQKQLSQRLQDLRRFYSILGYLAEQGSGPIQLSACTGRMTWPRRGVYFFIEPLRDLFGV